MPPSFRPSGTNISFVDLQSREYVQPLLAAHGKETEEGLEMNVRVLIVFQGIMLELPGLNEGTVL